MKSSSRHEKIRVNITVDKILLSQAKKKLSLFGGKLSTLFNAYLEDFVSTMDAPANKTHEDLLKHMKDLEDRLKKLEVKNN